MMRKTLDDHAYTHVHKSVNKRFKRYIYSKKYSKVRTLYLKSTYNSIIKKVYCLRLLMKQE